MSRISGFGHFFCERSAEFDGMRGGQSRGRHRDVCLGAVWSCPKCRQMFSVQQFLAESYTCWGACKHRVLFPREGGIVYATANTAQGWWSASAQWDRPSAAAVQEGGRRQLAYADALRRSVISFRLLATGLCGLPFIFRVLFAHHPVAGKGLPNSSPVHAAWNFFARTNDYKHLFYVSSRLTT